MSNATGGGGLPSNSIVFVQIALASLIHSNLTAGYFKRFDFVAIPNQPGSLSVAYFLYSFYWVDVGIFANLKPLRCSVCFILRSFLTTTGYSWCYLKFYQSQNILLYTTTNPFGFQFWVGGVSPHPTQKKGKLIGLIHKTHELQEDFFHLKILYIFHGSHLPKWLRDPFLNEISSHLNAWWYISLVCLGVSVSYEQCPLLISNTWL